ncbi:hypothetical protein IL306_010431 [Fusarium sp. DS 682]|nr:hypothetical protein IL306_010431 [Fusarium sp. DS 682]
MAWVILRAPEIPHDTPYVVAGVTFLATIYTSVVKGRVQHGLMRFLEKDLRSLVNYSDVEKDSRTRMKHVRSPQEVLDTSWRGVLVIDGLKEKILYNKKFFLVYLPCALLTTAIVAVFTPNNGSRNITYRPKMPGPLYSFNFTSDSEECAGQGEKPMANTFEWGMGNGSSFYARMYKGCPPTRIASHVSNINSKSPDKYAYVDAGVAVERTAMGAPVQLYRGPIFQKLDAKYGQFLRSTSQRVPVMTSNPVACRTGGGRLRVGDDKTLIFLPDKIPGLDGPKWENLSVSSAYRNFTGSSGMANFLLTDDRNNTVGPGIMFWSAYNDPKSETLFAKDLARTINDPDKKAGIGGSATYVVTCEINPLKSFEYRWVTLDLQTSKATNHTIMAYSRRLSGGRTCIPKKKTVGNVHFATATTSQTFVSMENYGLDGYFTTVHRVSGEDRGPPYAFNNSRNALEDTLGIISAIGVANMDLDDPVVADAVGKGWEATAIIEINRLGGNHLVLIALLPPIISFVILAYLFIMSFKQERHLGGGVVRGKQPEMYAAESVRELITLGRSTAEHVQLVEQQPLLK